MDDGLKMISPLSMRCSCIICWQRAMTSAEVAERRAASRTPSYATSETDCLKNIRSQISIAPNIAMMSRGNESDYVSDLVRIFLWIIPENGSTAVGTV